MSSDKPLYAKCPQCQSGFKLTPQHIEAAKGWVQCGMCGHVFFSGIVPAEPATPEPVTPEPTASSNSEPEVAEAPKPKKREFLVMAPGQVANSPTAQRGSADSLPDIDIPEAGTSPVLSGLTQRMAEDEAPTTMTFGPKLESIILMDPKSRHEDHDPGPLPVIPPRPEPAKAANTTAPGAAGAYTPPPNPSPASTKPTSSWMPRPSRLTAKPTKATLVSIAWRWFAILMVLLLIGQMVWHTRDSLSARYPSLRPGLDFMCYMFDCQLSLPRDPSRVSILGSDLQTESDGQLLLTLTMANRAHTSMAWPVIELTLTDVEDQPLARRVFAPSEYLASTTKVADGIPALTEVPLALSLRTRDIKAAGYRLRMFY